MNDQLVRWNALFFNRRFNELLGQIGTFAVGQHPTDHATAVDVQDHVKVVIRPFLRSFEFGDVP